jgi:hypothetical protein
MELVESLLSAQTHSLPLIATSPPQYQRFEDVNFHTRCLSVMLNNSSLGIKPPLLKPPSPNQLRVTVAMDPRLLSGIFALIMQEGEVLYRHLIL